MSVKSCEQLEGGKTMKKVSLGKTLLLSAASAAAAILLTPKSGKKMRNDLKDQAKRLVDAGKDKAEDLVSDVKESFHEAEEEQLYSEPAIAPQSVEPTTEKGEEWLDQVGEEQGMSEYPDASVSDPAGVFADDRSDLPAEEETYQPDLTDLDDSLASTIEPVLDASSPRGEEPEIFHREAEKE